MRLLFFILQSISLLGTLRAANNPATGPSSGPGPQSSGPGPQSAPVQTGVPNIQSTGAAGPPTAASAPTHPLSTGSLGASGVQPLGTQPAQHPLRSAFTQPPQPPVQPQPALFQLPAALPLPAQPVTPVAHPLGFPAPFSLLDTCVLWETTQANLLERLTPGSVMATVLTANGIGPHALFSTGTDLIDVFWNALLTYFYLVVDCSEFYASPNPADRLVLEDQTLKAYFFQLERLLGHFLPIFGDQSTLHDNSASLALRMLANTDFSLRPNDVFVKSGLTPEAFRNTMTQQLSAAAACQYSQAGGVETNQPGNAPSFIPLPTFPGQDLSGAAATQQQQQPALPPVDPSSANSGLSLSGNHAEFVSALSQITEDEFKTIPESLIPYFIDLCRYAHLMTDTTKEYAEPFSQLDSVLDFNDAINSPITRAEKVFNSLVAQGKAITNGKPPVDHAQILMKHGIPLQTAAPAPVPTSVPASTQTTAPSTPATNTSAVVPSTPATNTSAVVPSKQSTNTSAVVPSKQSTTAKPTTTSESDSAKEGDEWTTMEIGLAILVAAIVISLLGVGIWYFTKNKG